MVKKFKLISFPKCGISWMLMAALGIVITLFPSCNNNKEESKESEEVIEDTLDESYLALYDQIEQNFNNAKFAVGKADLSDEAKQSLHELAELMKQNDDVKVRIEGHTSPEGDPGKNQKLSEDRAQAAVDYLVKVEGIDPSRLKAVGMGSAHVIDPDNLEVNRRTEFIVLYKSSFDDYVDEYEKVAQQYAEEYEKAMKEYEEELDKSMKEYEEELEKAMNEYSAY